MDEAAEVPGAPPEAPVATKRTSRLPRKEARPRLPPALPPPVVGRARPPKEEGAEAVAEEANFAAEEVAVAAEEAVASPGEIATSIDNRPTPNLR